MRRVGTARSKRSPLPTLRPRTLAFAPFAGHGAAMHENLARVVQHNDGSLRHDWTREEIRALFRLPFPDLMFQAQDLHRRNFDPTKVKMLTLISIKTGGCPEDCGYCPQSAHFDTGLKAQKLTRLDKVLTQ